MELAPGDASRARLRLPRPFPALPPPGVREYFWLEQVSVASPLAGLLAAACNAPLAAQQTASLLALLRRGGGLAQALHPRELPRLVESNPLVSVAIVLRALSPAPRPPLTKGQRRARRRRRGAGRAAGGWPPFSPKRNVS
jgi:hypothetical protein